MNPMSPAVMSASTAAQCRALRDEQQIHHITQPTGMTAALNLAREWTQIQERGSRSVHQQSAAGFNLEPLSGYRTTMEQMQHTSHVNPMQAIHAQLQATSLREAYMNPSNQIPNLLPGYTPSVGPSVPFGLPAPMHTPAQAGNFMKLEDDWKRFLPKETTNINPWNQQYNNQTPGVGNLTYATMAHASHGDGMLQNSQPLFPTPEWTHPSAGIPPLQGKGPLPWPRGGGGDDGGGGGGGPYDPGGGWPSPPGG
jgi:hypothetical protein